MSCGILGERTGLPCVRPAGHSQKGRGNGHRAARSRSGQPRRYHFEVQAQQIPPGKLPEVAAAALGRYATWLAKPGETLHTKLREKLP